MCAANFRFCTGTTCHRKPFQNLEMQSKVSDARQEWLASKLNSVMPLCHLCVHSYRGTTRSHGAGLQQRFAAVIMHLPRPVHTLQCWQVHGCRTWLQPPSSSKAAAACICWLVACTTGSDLHCAAVFGLLCYHNVGTIMEVEGPRPYSKCSHHLACIQTMSVAQLKHKCTAVQMVLPGVNQTMGTCNCCYKARYILLLSPWWLLYVCASTHDAAPVQARLWAVWCFAALLRSTLPARRQI